MDHKVFTEDRRLNQVTIRSTQIQLCQLIPSNFCLTHRIKTKFVSMAAEVIHEFAQSTYPVSSPFVSLCHAYFVLHSNLLCLKYIPSVHSSLYLYRHHSRTSLDSRISLLTGHWDSGIRGPS